MMMLSLLSGQVVTYGDAINHTGNVLKISSCGMLPFSMGFGQRHIRKFMPHDGFHGIQASFVMRPEKVTLLRLVEDCGSYHLLYGTGMGQLTQLRQGYMPALDILPVSYTHLGRYKNSNSAIKSCVGTNIDKLIITITVGFVNKIL